MMERKEQGATPRASTPKKAPAVVTPLPRTVRKKTPMVKQRKSVSFQIRTAPETKELAERIAGAYETGGRSKLDADMYKRGLLLSLVLLGPNANGLYAGMSEQELARQLAPLFDRQYAVLDRHHLLAQYVYRVLPPGGMGQFAFVPASTDTDAHPLPNAQRKASENEQAHYRLGEEAQETLVNFAEEI